MESNALQKDSTAYMQGLNYVFSEIPLVLFMGVKSQLFVRFSRIKTLKVDFELMAANCCVQFSYFPLMTDIYALLSEVPPLPDSGFSIKPVKQKLFW